MTHLLYQYHSDKKIRIKRSARSHVPPEAPPEAYTPPVSVNYYDEPTKNYYPLQHPALCVSQLDGQSDEPRGMSNSKAAGLIAIGAMFVIMSVFGGAKADSYLHEKNSAGSRQNAQVVTQQNVATYNPVESYMRYWKLPESVISALKPLGYKGYWDTNDKALVDRFYFLPNNLRNNVKNNGRLLSYAAEIARDGRIDNSELSEFIELECSLR